MAGSDLAIKVLDTCRARGLMLATAESCTGGMVASSLVDIPGSSDVVDCGFVTYSNSAKSRMLGVPADLIEEHGAVSEPVARAMAAGALENSRGDIAVAITGVALALLLRIYRQYGTVEEDELLEKIRPPA